MRVALHFTSRIIIITFMVVSLGFSYRITPAEPYSTSQFTHPPLIAGNVKGNFAELGAANILIQGYFPSSWDNFSLVQFETSIALIDNTINRSAAFYVTYKVDFYDDNSQLVFQDSKVVYSLKNSGYQHISQFTITQRSFPSNFTGISQGTQWSGIVYLEGEIKLQELSSKELSNSSNIQYSSPSPSRNNWDFLFVPVNILFGLIFLIIVLTIYLLRSR